MGSLAGELTTAGIVDTSSTLRLTRCHCEDQYSRVGGGSGARLRMTKEDAVNGIGKAERMALREGERLRRLTLFA